MGFTKLFSLSESIHYMPDANIVNEASQKTYIKPDKMLLSHQNSQFTCIKCIFESVILEKHSKLVEKPNRVCQTLLVTKHLGWMQILLMKHVRNIQFIRLDQMVFRHQ